MLGEITDGYIGIRKSRKMTQIIQMPMKDQNIPRTTFTSTSSERALFFVFCDKPAGQNLGSVESFHSFISLRQIPLYQTKLPSEVLP